MEEATLVENKRRFACSLNATLFLQEAAEAISEGICPSGSVIPSIINTTQPFAEAPGLS